MFDEQSIINWQVTLDLACEDLNEVNQALSYYFIGYGLGFIFFFFPDAFGKRNSMIFAIITQQIGCTLSLFATDLKIKSIGLFLQGFFHLKTTLSYNYVTEFMPEEKKVLASTLMTAFDSSTLLFLSIYLAYYSRNIDEMYHIMYALAAVAIVLFIFIVPESPQWLLIHKGSNNQEAIAILNRIASFNGSDVRVP